MGAWQVQVSIFLCLCILLPVSALADDEELEGLPIVTIEFERSNIFDTSTPPTTAWPYRWANALHIVSKEEFLRSMLLFKEGDPYSSSQAAESARILRALGFINPVEIRAHKVSEGVEVTVKTHDQWTLKVSAKLGIFGNRTSYTADIEEENLLGWGKTVGVAYASDSERDTWSFQYFDPNIFNSRWRAKLLHQNLSDGVRDEIRIDRPFYSLMTRWSWGGEGAREELVDHLYSASESVVSGQKDSKRWWIWGGMRLPGNGDLTRRLVGGWEDRRDTFSNWEWGNSGAPYPTPENRIIVGPMVSYEQIADRFEVVTGFRAWTVQEDVALGPNFRIATTISMPQFGGDRQRLLISGGIHSARRHGGWLLLGDAWLSGRVENGNTQNLIAGGAVGAAQLGSRGWQLRLLAETSQKLDLDRQLTLGADVGLRGWDPEYFDGTGRALINIQWRTLIKEQVLGLFSVGAVFFGDIGTTWDPRVGFDTDGIRGDIGVGLLFDLANVGRTSLLRIDVALPDDGTGVTVTISTSSLF